MDPRKEKDGVSPIEELTQVTLDPHIPDWIVSIGSLLKPELHKEMIQFLIKNQDIFTCSYEDIPGIDPQVIYVGKSMF